MSSPRVQALTSVLNLARVYPDRPASLQDPLLDVNAVLQLAARHGLDGLVADQLASCATSQEDVSLARRTSSIAAARSLWLARDLERAVRLLNASDIQPVILKGLPLAIRFYARACHRTSSDIDLLVRENELNRATTALTAAGLTQDEPERQAVLRRWHHHATFSGWRHPIELHFRAISGHGASLRTETLFARARSFEVSRGTQALVLGPEDELVYLCAHAAQHLLARLSWVLDLKLLLLRHPALDLEGFVARAREAGLIGACHVACRAARLWLDAPTDRLLPKLAPSSWRMHLLDTLVLRPALEASKSSKLGREVAHLVLSDRPRNLGTAARRTLAIWRGPFATRQ